LAFLAVLLGGLLLGYQVVLGEWFRLTEVVISGCDQVPVEALRQRVQPEIFDPSRPHSGSLWLVHKRRLEQAVLSFPGVKEVYIRRLPPHRLRLELVERTPVVRLGTSPDAALVDGEGRVFSVRDTARYPALPLLQVEGRSLGSLPAGSRLEGAGVREALLLAQYCAQTKPFSLAAIRIGQQGFLELGLADGSAVRLGRPVHLEAKLRAAQVMLRRREHSACPPYGAAALGAAAPSRPAAPCVLSIESLEFCTVSEKSVAYDGNDGASQAN